MADPYILASKVARRIARSDLAEKSVATKMRFMGYASSYPSTLLVSGALSIME